MFRLYEKMVNLDYMQREDLREKLISLLMKQFNEFRLKKFKKTKYKKFYRIRIFIELQKTSR